MKKPKKGLANIRKKRGFSSDAYNCDQYRIPASEDKQFECYPSIDKLIQDYFLKLFEGGRWG